MIIITTAYYNKTRVKELLKCLELNSKLSCIEKIIYFLERAPNDDNFYAKIIKNPKIDLQIINHRPMVKEMIEYANKKYKDRVCILTNSDIYYTDSLLRLKRVDFSKCNIALTRYNILAHTMATSGDSYPGFIVEYNGIKLKTMWDNGLSADSWIFKLPLNMEKMDMEFPLGTLQCDGYIHTQLLKDKPLFNPVHTIMSIHLHELWHHSSYNNMKHSSRTFWKETYRQNQSRIAFCKLEDCPLKKKRVREKKKKQPNDSNN
tara:strand:- start:12166 stop:12948 length:783 start_codon:yes stop_codon:yes gene_type:complete